MRRAPLSCDASRTYRLRGTASRREASLRLKRTFRKAEFRTAHASVTVAKDFVNDDQHAPIEEKWLENSGARETRGGLQREGSCEVGWHGRGYR
ncbi:hypothetical protein PUN4_770013 [Paraburkholderia unamae]|nr:hypothetical protein PUN4_770013 [Paraburkholderia unamae]